jgi:hypothetical protein
MNVLLLHDKSTSNEAVWQAQDRAEGALAVAGLDWRITSARDAITAYEKTIGGVIRGWRWGDWVTHAVGSYSGFIRPYDLRLGKGNAEIVAGALSVHKPVVYLPESGTGCGVTAVRCVDDQDWSSGYLLVISGAGS